MGLYRETYFHSSDQFVYSPLSLVLFQWGHLPRDAAALNLVGWWALLALAGATAAVLAWRWRQPGENPPKGKADLAARVALAGAATLLFYPAVKAYTLGNLQCWLNLLYVVAFALWLRHRALAAGLALGLASVVKPQMALFLLWAILRGDRRLALGMLAVVIPLGVASLVSFGWPVHAEYVDLMGHLTRRGESYFASHCVNALLNRMLFLGNNLNWDGGHTQLPYNPFVHLATVASSTTLLGVALFWRRWDAARRDPLDFATAMLSFTMAAPIAFEHHYGFLVPVFWLAVVRIMDGEAAARNGRLALLPIAFFLSANFIWPTRWLAPTHLNFLQSYLFFGALILLVMMYRLRATGHPAA